MTKAKVRVPGEELVPRKPVVSYPVVNIPTDAIPAWEALSRALNRPGAVIPCTSVARAWWTSEDATDRATAAIACIGCTALDICGRYADLAGITWHVYGGTDRQRRNTE